MTSKRALGAPEELDLMRLMARFSTEDEARIYLEQVRWHSGRFCPKCGNADESRIHALSPNAAKKIRKGLYHCGECREQFTVTVGTVFESTKIPLNKWLIAFFLLSGSKKGVSALQIQRHLNIGSYRTAWFLMHRIRFAMKDGAVTEPLTGVVEADETYIGARNKRGTKRGRPGVDSHKAPVVSLIERGGKVRSTHVTQVTGKSLKAILQQNVAPSATLMTDEYQVYTKPGKAFAKHETVNHGKEEYVRSDVHVNTAEGFFSLLKRGINGIYHHVSKQHLHQYLGEFDFRYNTRKMSDGERTIDALARVPGKRLMLRRPKKVS